MFDFVSKLHESHIWKLNTTKIDETFINNFFITALQLLYWIFVKLPNY